MGLVSKMRLPDKGKFHPGRRWPKTGLCNMFLEVNLMKVNLATNSLGIPGDVASASREKVLRLRRATKANCQTFCETEATDSPAGCQL